MVTSVCCRVSNTGLISGTAEIIQLERMLDADVSRDFTDPILGPWRHLLALHRTAGFVVTLTAAQAFGIIAAYANLARALSRGAGANTGSSW
jgi:hypothetical protein